MFSIFALDWWDVWQGIELLERALRSTGPPYAISPSTASCVELALPAALLQRVAGGTTFSCFDSRGAVIDVDGWRQLLEVRQWLIEAVSEAMMPLTFNQLPTAMRHLDRAVDKAVTPLEGLPAVRCARAIGWWLHERIDDRSIELWEGSTADRAITRLLDWCGETMNIMRPTEADRLDTAAQKSARRIAEALQGCGYFVPDGVTAKESLKCLG